MTFDPLSSIHYPLSSGLAHKQLLRVPEREGEDGARAMIAEALIGRDRRMARDDRDDRQFFSEDSLNLVKGRAAAVRVSLAGLLREQIVNSGFPFGRGPRLLRSPDIKAATAAQEIGVGGRVGFGGSRSEKAGLIIVAFRNAPLKSPKSIGATCILIPSRERSSWITIAMSLSGWFVDG